jgi:hypothetical protein
MAPAVLTLASEAKVIVLPRAAPPTFRPVCLGKDSAASVTNLYKVDFGGPRSGECCSTSTVCEFFGDMTGGFLYLGPSSSFEPRQSSVRNHSIEIRAP